jgi:hypothetical protein
VFGPGGNPIAGYPATRPLWRNWNDDRVDAMHSEFGVLTIGPAAMMFDTFWALEQPK